MSCEKLTVWIFQTGEPLHCDEGSPRPMRAMNLTNALIKSGHKVVLWSSCFNHQEKRQRKTEDRRVRFSDSLELRLVPSPGYKRNIGPGRLLDHALLGLNLQKLLNSECTVPDVAFVGYPPIEAAAVMTRWLAARKVPCMVDVKDQWPVIFIHAIPTPLRRLGRVALAPYFYYGRRVLREATALSSMSDDFLRWAAGFAGRAVHDLDRVVPLTTATGQFADAEMQEADRWWDRQGIYADGTQRICFIGSHSKAFDMEPVAHAAKSMAAVGNSCQFVFCGLGENSRAWQDMFAGLPNVYFPGWIDRVKIEALALRSSAALAPYHNSEDFMRSIPNKVLDYLSLGLPILSPLRGEVGSLISQYHVGMSYGSEFNKTLESCISDLRGIPGHYENLSNNSFDLFNERFAFDKVYGGLVTHLEMLAQCKLEV